MISFTVDINPLPKERPRLGNGHAYTTAKTRDYEHTIAQYALITMNQAQLDTMEGDLGLIVRFYRKDNRRVDLDNLLKAIKDALNGIIWYDDSQVTSVYAKLERNAGKSARVEIEVMLVSKFVIMEY